MKRMVVLAVALVAAAGSGCANARYVHKAQDEGIISIRSNSDSWPDYNRSNALKLIEQHVGPYDIVEEKEVVTGQVTDNTQNTKREATVNSQIPFLPAEKQTTTTTTSSRDVTEWHIHYKKKYGSVTQFPGVNGGLPNGTPVSQSDVVQTGFATTPPSAIPPEPRPISVSPAAMMGGGSPGLPPPNLNGIR